MNNKDYIVKELIKKEKYDHGFFSYRKDEQDDTFILESKALIINDIKYNVRLFIDFNTCSVVGGLFSHKWIVFRHELTNYRDIDTLYDNLEELLDDDNRKKWINFYIDDYLNLEISNSSKYLHSHLRNIQFNNSLIAIGFDLNKKQLSNPFLYELIKDFTWANGSTFKDYSPYDTDVDDKEIIRLSLKYKNNKPTVSFTKSTLDKFNGESLSRFFYQLEINK